MQIDGFLAPGHVSMVVGEKPFEFIAKTYNKPIVVSGFEPLDILQSIWMVLKQLAENRCLVENHLTAKGDRLAMTTDSYVVDPLFFPGGDIGKLAVTGTVNDLAVGGAKPLYLTCGMIIEEGFLVKDLQRIVASMKATADAAAIVDARGEMELENTIETDCQALNGLVEVMLQSCPDIHCMRDATRGGIATVLNEFAESSNVGITLDETALPIRREVRGMCEILGLDPLYLANE
ncbi:PREDICTED: hydrogenase expression/formation protein HypE-like, partial [Priapulus caudatus]|uniref:Hydrogenase expression/formation protein HypE-like n=1 Tax=Priapulus caudatus TaxID=37621 RepID=A0ABM1F738_PRICU